MAKASDEEWAADQFVKSGLEVGKGLGLGTSLCPVN